MSIFHEHLSSRRLANNSADPAKVTCWAEPSSVALHFQLQKSTAHRGKAQGVVSIGRRAMHHSCTPAPRHGLR